MFTCDTNIWYGALIISPVAHLMMAVWQCRVHTYRNRWCWPMAAPCVCLLSNSCFNQHPPHIYRFKWRKRYIMVRVRCVFTLFHNYLHTHSPHPTVRRTIRCRNVRNCDGTIVIHTTPFFCCICFAAPIRNQPTNHPSIDGGDRVIRLTDYRADSHRRWRTLCKRFVRIGFGLVAVKRVGSKWWFDWISETS